MMIGEFHRPHPTVQISPQWDPYEDPTAEINSPYPVYTNSPNHPGLFGSPDRSPFTAPDSLGSLQRYLPSNEPDTFDDETFDAFTCDNFRMYDFKVLRCAKARSHDWTECPFAHPGEKARRRDPRKHSYSGTPCPEFRKGSCRRGDSCEFAHGVFECWLHPDRYRTQACKDGLSCRRRICFFAHSPDQLRGPPLQSGRVISNPPEPDSYDGSPLRRSFDSYICNNNSNHNTSPFDSSLGTFYNTSSFGSSSPPASPPSPPPFLSTSYNELVSSMGGLQLAKAMLSRRVSNLRPELCSLPITPTRVPARPPQFEEYEVEEPVMERVESGRDLRTKLYARLSKENSFGPVNSSPDVGWISDLIQ